MKIPKFIHWVWYGKDISPIFVANMQRVILDNPDYNFFIWSDRPGVLHNTIARMDGISSELMSEVEVLDPMHALCAIEDEGVRKHISSIVARELGGPLRNYAAASDVVRLLILNCYGGIYMDADVEINYSLDDLSAPRGVMFLPSTRNLFSNAIIAASENNKLLYQCLKKVAYYYYLDPFCSEKSWEAKRSYPAAVSAYAFRTIGTTSMTGPRMVKRVIEEFMPDLFNSLGELQFGSAFPKGMFKDPDDSGTSWLKPQFNLRAADI